MGAAQVLLRQEGPEGTDTMPSVSIRVTEVAGREDRNRKWMREGGVGGMRGPGAEGQWARRESPGAEGGPGRREGDPMVLFAEALL